METYTERPPQVGSEEHVITWYGVAAPRLIMQLPLVSLILCFIAVRSQGWVGGDIAGGRGGKGHKAPSQYRMLSSFPSLSIPCAMIYGTAGHEGWMELQPSPFAL